MSTATAIVQDVADVYPPPQATVAFTSAAPTPSASPDDLVYAIVDVADAGSSLPGQLGEGFPNTADGTWIVVTLTATNNGSFTEYVNTRAFFASSAEGTQFTPDYLATAGINPTTLLMGLKPGATVTVKLAFDVPTGSGLTNVQLPSDGSTTGHVLHVS